MNRKTRITAVQPVAVLILLATGPAGANTYNVDRFDDTTISSCSQLVWDDCSLRGAIIAANNHPGDDIVRLHTGTYTLTIAGRGEDLCQTGDLDVRDNLLILGDGPDMTVIGGAGIDRVIDVRTGDHLTVRGVTITGGDSQAGDGGGIKVEDGSLRLESCVVSGNSAPVGYGGAVFDAAFNVAEGVQIINTWITANAAANTSAVYTTSVLQIKQSTVSGNHSTGNGSAIFARGQNSVLFNSTVGDNTSASSTGGGLMTDAANCTVGSSTIAGNQGAQLRHAAPGVTSLFNTIIVGTCQGDGAISSVSGNLESPGNTCNLGTYDLSNVANPMLSDLGWFGGPTPVRRPLPSSPAIDTWLADIVCPSVDQRGVSRPRDGGGDPTANCDIGAVELVGAGEIFVEGFESGFMSPWMEVMR